MPAFISLLAAFAIAHAAAVPHAEHFDIALRVVSGAQRAEAYMDTTPPIGGVNKRPVAHVKVGDTIQVAWRMKSAYPHGVMKGVTIHFFVVHEDQLGQKPVPDPAGPAGVADYSFDMDFAPEASAQGTLKLKLTEPGNYLVRVQSENTHQEHDHEHFSAIDVTAQ